MNIICRPYLYKVITPSNKSRMITTWNEGDPIESFDAFDKVKVALSVSDIEIENKYHEITKKRAEKLWAEKNGKPAVEEVEETNIPNDILE